VGFGVQVGSGRGRSAAIICHPSPGYRIVRCSRLQGSRSGAWSAKHRCPRKPCWHTTESECSAATDGAAVDVLSGSGVRTVRGCMRQRHAVRFTVLAALLRQDSLCIAQVGCSPARLVALPPAQTSALMGPGPVGRAPSAPRRRAPEAGTKLLWRRGRSRRKASAGARCASDFHLAQDSATKHEHR